MTGVRQLTDRAEIKAWLERDRRWAIYALGDLADGMFEQCEWYTAGDSLALIFRGLDFIPLVTVGGADGIEPILESAITLPRIFLNQRLEHLPAVMRYYECSEPHLMLRMILEKFKPIDPPANDGVCIM